jgi:hypothetical protein
MLEVVSLPIGPADNSVGHEADFFPAFLDIIQNFTLEAMEKDINAYGGLSNYSLNLPETKEMRIAFSENDMSDEITEEFIQDYFYDGMIVTSEETIGKLMSENRVEAVIGFVAAPIDAQNGSYCYKMLINNQAHKVYYFRKHKISKKLGVGFLAEDITRITSYREY